MIRPIATALVVFVAVVLAYGLAGCAPHLEVSSPPALTEPEVRIVEVPRQCVPDGLGPAPTGLETKETLAAIADGPTRYVRLAADWAARVARMAEVEPVVVACRNTPVP